MDQYSRLMVGSGIAEGEVCFSAGCTCTIQFGFRCTVNADAL